MKRPPYFIVEEECVFLPQRSTPAYQLMIFSWQAACCEADSAWQPLETQRFLLY